MKRRDLRRQKYLSKGETTGRISPKADGSLKQVFGEIGVPEKVEFIPDPFQLKALEAIDKADCLVTAPTGAGKTWIAEQSIAKIHKKGGRSWYASPLKALSNSKYHEFSAIFGAHNVGILTGDRKDNPDAPIIVGTTEILRNQLYDAMHHGLTLPTDFVILDEAHFLGDEERGVVWEETMIYLPARIPLLMLSATIGNAEQIAAWLSSIRKKECIVVAEFKRPVPLFPLFLHPSGTLLPLLSEYRSKEKAQLSKKIGDLIKNRRAGSLSSRSLPPFGDILAVLKKYRLLPAIFFLKSRADCDSSLDLCRNHSISEFRKKEIRTKVEDLDKRAPYISSHRHMEKLENYAVASHHSGQLPSWKLLVETLMTEGLLDAVFATSTVAAGVNFPARTVAFLNSDRYNGKEFMPLSSTEFHQMTGRAGRRGMDKIGFAVAIPGKFLDLKLIAKLIHSPPLDISSQIKIDFSMVLNLLLSHSPDQIEDLLTKSFAAYLLRKKKEKRDKKSIVNGSPHLREGFLHHLDFLVETGFAGNDGKLTEDGIWASRLRVDQPLIIAEGFRTGAFPIADSALLAGIIASFVNEKETDEKIDKRFTPKKLIQAFLGVKKSLLPFAKLMFERGFEVRPLFLRPAAAIYAWAAGDQWERAVLISEMDEGNLAMLVLRTADNLRHIRSLAEVFPEASRAAAKAIDLILRDPVVPFDYPAIHAAPNRTDS
ncbi:MAG: DEAD/DEAH box helicase [Desulfobacteraceae bacterium]|nr:MAG: DEAD/DEAH box helicase [Desulfobacteraceae bacterium]